MYIVIVCVNCNGSSQVEESMLGQVVECPLCHKPTVARTPTAVLPVAKPVGSSSPPTAPLQQVPLSLDDAAPLPPIEKPKAAEKEFPRKKTESVRKKRSPIRTAVYATISLLLTVLVMTGIYAAFKYGNGQIPDGDWKHFQPPGGECTIQMPGDPTGEDIPPTGPGELGGKRFMVKRWFERVELSVGWMDYDASATDLRYAQIVQPIRDREIKRMHGTLVGESPSNYRVGSRTIEDRLIMLDVEKDGKGFMHIYFDADLERFKYLIRTELARKQFLVFAPVGGVQTGIWFPVEVLEQIRRREIEPGQRIRIWFATAQGRKINSSTSWLPKFFTSFVPD